MTIENTTSPAVTEADEVVIMQAAATLIRQAAVKGGVSVDQVSEEAKRDAYNYAKASYEEQKAQESNPLWKELQAEREAHALTRKTLEATQQVRPNVVSGAKDNLPDPNVIRARMGEGAWRALTNDGRLITCGLDPASITAADVAESKRVFGKHPDTNHAVDLAKRDFARYKRLKNIAIVAGYQGQ